MACSCISHWGRDAFISSYPKLGLRFSSPLSQLRITVKVQLSFRGFPQDGLNLILPTWKVSFPFCLTLPSFFTFLQLYPLEGPPRTSCMGLGVSVATFMEHYLRHGICPWTTWGLSTPGYLFFIAKDSKPKHCSESTRTQLLKATFTSYQR